VTVGFCIVIDSFVCCAVDDENRPEVVKQINSSEMIDRRIGRIDEQIILMCLDVTGNENALMNSN
jgi:hypothetical protein